MHHEAAEHDVKRSVGEGQRLDGCHTVVDREVRPLGFLAGNADHLGGRIDAAHQSARSGAGPGALGELAGAAADFEDRLARLDRCQVGGLVAQSRGAAKCEERHYRIVETRPVDDAASSAGVLGARRMVMVAKHPPFDGAPDELVAADLTSTAQTRRATGQDCGKAGPRPMSTTSTGIGVSQASSCGPVLAWASMIRRTVEGRGTGSPMMSQAALTAAPARLARVTTSRFLARAGRPRLDCARQVCRGSPTYGCGPCPRTATNASRVRRSTGPPHKRRGSLALASKGGLGPP